MNNCSIGTPAGW